MWLDYSVISYVCGLETELGEAIKHFLELGQKVRLRGIGIFKVGFSSIGVKELVDCTASTITTRHERSACARPRSETRAVGLFVAKLQRKM